MSYITAPQAFQNCDKEVEARSLFAQASAINSFLFLLLLARQLEMIAWMNDNIIETKGINKKREIILPMLGCLIGSINSAAISYSSFKGGTWLFRTTTWCGIGLGITILYVGNRYLYLR